MPKGLLMGRGGLCIEITKFVMLSPLLEISIDFVQYHHGFIIYIIILLGRYVDALQEEGGSGCCKH